MSPRAGLTRTRAIIGLTAAQLVHYRLPTLLAVSGVTIAVVLMVLLSGIGVGVLTAGTEGLAWLQQDLWVTAGPLDVAPGSVGGVETPLLEAHTVATRIGGRPDVASAGAMSFQAVYASANGSEFTTLVGVGVTGDTSQLNIRQGLGFTTGDIHYANGSYDGPMTHEVVIDERTAGLLDLGINDTVNIGGTLASARRNKFTVVGISPTFSTFLGTATVTLHLAELQSLTGSTGSDPAALVTVDVEDGADPAAVRGDLEQSFPEYSVRTNREQLVAVLGRQSAVLASALALVVIAVIVGLALVVNVLGLLVYHQREELLALRATGVSPRTLVAMVAGQGIAIGLLGGLLGLLIAPLFSGTLNPIIESLSGFPKLIKLPWWILGAGGGLAFLIGTIGAGIAGWRIAALDSHERLGR